MSLPRVVYRYEDCGPWVPLTARRVAWCWGQGRLFREDALRRGVRDRQAEGHGGVADEAQAISLHAFGLMGEYATAVALGVADWRPKMGVFMGESDVGHGVDVRTARTPSYGLWVRSREPDGRASVLVLLHEIPDIRPRGDGRYREGRARVAGWYPVSEARRHPEWRQHFGTGRATEVVVPQSALLPIESLRDKLFPQSSAEEIPSIVTRVPEQPKGSLYERIAAAYVWSSDGIRCSGCRLYDPNPNAKLTDFARSMHYNGCRAGIDGEFSERVRAVEEV